MLYQRYLTKRYTVDIARTITEILKNENNKEEEKIKSFIEVCDSFFVEFDGIFNHYIEDAERDALIFKYKALYHELQRYSGIPSKVDDFVKLEDFKKKYKDFPRLVLESNVDIKCQKLLIKVELFFIEFDGLFKHCFRIKCRD